MQYISLSTTPYTWERHSVTGVFWRDKPLIRRDFFSDIEMSLGVTGGTRHLHGHSLSLGLVPESYYPCQIECKSKGDQPW